MIRKLLAAATFALALSPVALAQDAPKFSTKTSKISEILANAGALPGDSAGLGHQAQLQGGEIAQAHKLGARFNRFG